MKKTLTFFMLTSCLAIGIMAIGGCEFEKPNVTGVETDNEQLNIPLFRMEYDQETVTTSTRWPNHIIGRAGRGKTTEGEAEYLVDYANTHTTFTIDDSGYIGIRTDWLEGNADIPMPMDMWNQVKDETNPFHPDHKSKVAFELKDGTYTSYATDGSIIATYPYPADSLKLDTDLISIDSIAYYLGYTMSSDSADMKADIMNHLMQEGVNFRLLGDYEILVVKTKHSQEREFLVKMVVNTKTGRIQRRAMYDTQGNLDQVTLLSYDLISGMPFPVQIITYNIATNHNGERDIIAKTIETRSNISIQHQEI
ncbi:MAG: hypothetical protein ACE5D8_10705 [Fidelibacterota bacterium]